MDPPTQDEALFSHQDDYRQTPAQYYESGSDQSSDVSTVTRADPPDDEDYRYSNQDLVAYDRSDSDSDCDEFSDGASACIGYNHCFITVPTEKRFLLLYTFLKKNKGRKILILFSSAKSVKFHSKLLNHLKLLTLSLHRHQSKDKFIDTFLKFSEQDSGLLCSTDLTGQKIDVPPSVDWVIQFEPPDDPNDYIYNIRRTPCDPDRCGKALLFLSPGEIGFLTYFGKARIPVSEYEFPKVANIQTRLEQLVEGSESLNRYARGAYGSYLVKYATHEYRDVYNVHDLDREAAGWAFGFVKPPAVDVGGASSVTSVNRSMKSTRSRRGSSSSKEDSIQPRKPSWMKKEKAWKYSHASAFPPSA